MDYPKCARHKVTMDVWGCYVCRLENHLNESPVIRQMFSSSTPRYRYWRIKREGKSERTFEYTTETAEAGKYWAVERRWVKVRGGHRGKIVRKAGFKMRRKAKERALAWYEKARTPAIVV